MSMEMKNDLE